MGFSTEWLLEVANGQVPGHFIKRKFGRNDDVDGQEDIWEGGNLYTGMPDVDVEDYLQIFSSSDVDTLAGDGAQKVLVEGLSLAGAEIDETVNMAGTGMALTTKKFWRQNRTKVVQAKTRSTFNVGTITARHASTNANIFSKMPIGRNQTHIAAWTVPVGHRANIINVGWTFNKQGTGSAQLDILVREPGQPWQSQFPFGALESGAEDRIFELQPIVAKSDILIRCYSVTNTNASISAWFDILYIRI